MMKTVFAATTECEWGVSVVYCRTVVRPALISKHSFTAGLKENLFYGFDTRVFY